jgi:hypothetical protein
LRRLPPVVPIVRAQAAYQPSSWNGCRIDGSNPRHASASADSDATSSITLDSKGALF